MSKQLPSWVTDLATWVITALLGVLSWFLVNTVNDMKSEVKTLSGMVFQLRQDVAVMGAVLDTKTKLCRVQK